jgi:DNA-directed RNA polymerase subunit M/transcription elongation factor TFIIS
VKECPECKNKLYEYTDQESGFIQSICWKCGHYEDNSPAFRLLPESFKDIVRDNPVYFMKKYSKTPNLNKEKF